MLMRQDCVGDDGIGDRAKAQEFLGKRLQSVETPIWVQLIGPRKRNGIVCRIPGQVAKNDRQKQQRNATNTLGKATGRSGQAGEKEMEASMT